MTMKEFRCSNCNKLLGMIEGRAEIRCQKCWKVNTGITFTEWMKENLSNNPPGARIPIPNDFIVRE